MNKNKKISIIIAVYNGEKFLKRCLDSIINQTYTNLEIIIVNDGSTDNTKKIIETYIEMDSRIIFINKCNTGVSESRNLGIENATGDYITFVDADDWLEENALESLNQLLYEEYDVIRYNYFKNYDSGMQIKNGYCTGICNKKITTNEIKNEILPKILSGNMPAYVWLLLIRKDVINKVEKFNVNLHMMEDTIFYVNLLTNIDNMYIYNKNLYHYYYELSSASHSFKNSMRNFYNILLVNEIETKIICNQNLNIEKNKLLFYTSHAQIIEDICFMIFKNYSINEGKEKISEICNNIHTYEILSHINTKMISIHRKIGIYFIREKKINLLIVYYKFRKILYHIKNYYTKRKIN